MTLKKLIEDRYSMRSFKDRTVEKDKIEYILDCVRLAPSAVNFQPWHFYIISKEEDKLEVIKAYNREWFKKAPIYIIACGNREEAWKRSNHDNKNHLDIDVAIACEHLCLAATELGLGTCWVCNFDPAIISTFLNLSQAIEPIAIFPIGYPEDDIETPIKKRKELYEISTWK